MASLLIDKAAVAQKCPGGVAHFREVFFKVRGELNEEDDELFAVAGMNSDEFDPEALVELGLTYDASRGYSPDFVIHQRYHGFLWEVDWIEEDSFYAWHRDTDPVVKETARSLGKTSRKKLAAICEAGQDPFIPLTLRNLHTHPMLL
jgi:hypothetical protein